jgi:hypothetical protein
MLVTMPAGAGWAAPSSDAAGAEKPAAETTAPATQLPSRPPDGKPAAPPPAPEPKLTREDALARLKEAFTLPPETEKARIDVSLAERPGQTTWEFMYMISEGTSTMGMSFASVDAVTGQVLSFNKGYLMGQPVPTGPLTVRPEAEAREKALALARKLYPEALAGMKLAEGSGADTLAYYYGFYGSAGVDAYNFVWQQDVNGVPYPASRIQVSLDKQTLECVTFAANLSEGVHFAEGPAKLSADQAMQRYRELVKPQLFYQPEYAPYPFVATRPTAMKLVYSFGFTGRQLDAMTGNFADAELFPAPAAAGEPETVPAGTGAVVKPAALPLTDAAAVSLGTMLLEPPDGIRVQVDRNYSPQAGLASVSWYDSQGRGNAQAALDRKTGLIQNAWRSVPAEMPKMTTTPEGMTTVTTPAMPAPGPGSAEGSAPAGPTPEQKAKAKDVAVSLVQTFYSQYVDQLRLLPLENPMPYSDPNSLRFTFERFVNGIPVSSNTVSVAVDMRTMTWQSISANWTDGVTFPDPAGAISAEAASATFFKETKAVLTYQPVQTMPVPGPYMGPPQVQEARLVFSLQGATPPALDALTGAPYTAGGKPGFDQTKALDAIQGHWAEAELRYAVRTGTIMADKLNPDATLSRMEAVYMLLGAQRLIRVDSWQDVKLPFTDLASDDPAYAIVASAWRQGWLQPAAGDTFRPNAAVTRAEFVVWSARLLGLGDLARSSLRAELAYTDMQGLTVEQQNAAAFLRGLGLLSAGEQFRGNDPITQAEAASLMVRLYNYLIAH